VTVLGVWLALAGAVALLAGLSSRHRARRLRRHGLTTWGVTVTPPDKADPGDILVYGRWGRTSDWAFVAAGVVSVLAGIIIAVHP